MSSVWPGCSQRPTTSAVHDLDHRAPTPRQKKWFWRLARGRGREALSSLTRCPALRPPLACEHPQCPARPPFSSSSPRRSAWRLAKAGRTLSRGVRGRGPAATAPVPRAARSGAGRRSMPRRTSPATLGWVRCPGRRGARTTGGTGGARVCARPLGSSCRALRRTRRYLLLSRGALAALAAAWAAAWAARWGRQHPHRHR